MKNIKLFCQLILMAGFLTACAHTEHKGITVADVSAPEAWGETKRVTSLKHLYFSDQPDAEALKMASEKGVVAVINLRGPDEMTWDEAATVEKLGMKYYNIPLMTASPSFDPNVIQQIEAAVAGQNHAPVLVHCSSSNRVGAWLAIHLADKHKMDKEEALAIGRKAGLTSETLEERVKMYWEE